MFIMENAAVSRPVVLTPLDHLNPKIYNVHFLSFRSNNPRLSVSRLETGVATLTSLLPFLRGQIATSSQLPGKSGVLEVQVPQDVLSPPMLQVKDFSHKGLPANHPIESTHGAFFVMEFDECYSPLSPSALSIHPSPILRFQCNVMSDGVILSTAYDSRVFDGSAIRNVYEMLAKCCREPSIGAGDLPTCYETEARSRSILSNMVDDQLLSRLRAEDHDIAHGNIPANTEHSGTQLNTCVFTLAPKKIEVLKRICTMLLPQLQSLHRQTEQGKEAMGSEDPPTFVSTNDVLVALLATSVRRARKNTYGDSTTTGKLYMPVDFRSRLRPPLSRHYLGNTTLAVDVSFDIDQTINTVSLGENEIDIEPAALRTIAEIACRIRVRLGNMDDGFMRSVITYFQALSDWDLQGLTAPDLILTSWRHFTVYALDFGSHLGKLDSFDIQAYLTEGLCVFMPPRESTSDGSGQVNRGKTPWEVCVTLKAAEMESLVQDPVLRWALRKDDH